MYGIEELGHFSGFYRSKYAFVVPESPSIITFRESGSLAPHSITTEDQITWSTHPTLFNRGSFACSECDSCAQEQNVAR
jgi:hypothetical protein